jgi:membrane fusion protein (multidrug efflux system)
MLSGTPPRFPLGALPLLCGAALLVAGCSQKKSAALDLGPPVVLVTEATQQDVPDVREWVGSLDGSINADVRAQVSGRLISRNYKEGRTLTKKASCSSSSIETHQAALEQAKANLAQAQANQLQTDLQEKRMVELYDQKVESKQDRDNAVQSNTAAKATVQANQAAVDQAQINLDYCKVVAPLTGIAGFANPGIGALVSPSDSQPLTTISVVDPIRAYFYISEQDYLKVAKWRQENPDAAAKPLPVRLVLADGSLYGETGTIYTLDRSVDNQTGTIRLAASFPNSGNVLRPGQFVRVRIEARTIKGAVVVPQRAVNQLQTSYELAVVGPDNKAEIRAVQVGDQFD